ncbi:hypothetical protein [Clostridium sp.]|uniref:hypothetical protein n=1 Tax=Clostridium sp. TaxID=1506 RepID=UPI00283D3E08|nr:hypothetical protein [Clostridium sp.]MDR3597693.1 hypothetical protein [Clostridium sp.]
MTHEEFREQFYFETGELIESDSELEEYAEAYGYSLSDNTFNKSNYWSSCNDDTDKLDFFSSNVIDELDNIFNSVANRCKKSIKETAETIIWNEFIYYTKIFLCKSFLYFTIKDGIKKGYNHKDL